ncbi:MAG: protein translocase subunit SecF [Anaerolineae bacterium]|nr:protein translocase subunit SecF [Anaerolineae bacterium]
MLNILGKRYYFFALSLLFIIPGLLILAINGAPLSIDFKGGSLLEINFDSGVAPLPAEIIKIYDDLGITDMTVQTTGVNTYIIRSEFIDEAKRGEIISSLEDEFNSSITILRSDSVGPTIGREVTGRAGLAIAIAALGVIIYITFAFRGVAHAFRYGICAIIAMAHDALVVLSLAAIGGLLFGWQMDSLFLTAFLTVIGFSVQDKIVVFDRIRENSTIYRKLPFEKLANHSIVQTLQRSINTQLMTSEFLLLALALFGGVTLREFAIILLVGLLSGTYSSIFIAAPILVIWETQEWKTWFKPKKTSTV